jgi:hypothetical protein
MKGCVNFRPNNFAGWEHRMLQAEALDPEAVEMLSHCYEMILKDLGLASRTDPITALVAERVIEFAKSGERDTKKLHEQVLRSFKD